MLMFRHRIPAIAAVTVLVSSCTVIHAQGMPSGTITDPAGAAVSGCVVQLESSEGAILQEMVSDAAGKFHLTAVAAGPYFLEIAAPLHRSPSICACRE
jgi:uncharacterized surface anchored protein